MDQDKFRETYREVNECFCAFEKSILTNRVNCSQAERFCIAEREGVHCRSEISQQRCLRTLDLLRQQARFALHSREERIALPHAKAMRVQVGGMRGIRALVEPDALDPLQVTDVDAILSLAEQIHGNLESLPFSDIMPHIAAFQGRPKRTRRR